MTVVSVDTETGEILPALSLAEARTLTDQIRTAAEGTWSLMMTAYAGRAWVAMEYLSWDDYLTGEFGNLRLRLPREEREEVVASMRDAGMSTRAIAAATGTSDATVRRDLSSGATNDAPEPEVEPRFKKSHQPTKPKPDPKPVTGKDGKTYKPKTSTPMAPKKPKRSPIVDDAQKAGWQLRKAVERLEKLATDDRYLSNREQVAAQISGHLTNAVEVCQDLLNGLSTEPQEAR